MTIEQNKSPPQHTPLPWKSHGTTIKYQMDSGLTENLATVHGGKFGEPHPNTEFIVRACNSHYELLEALRALQKYASDLNCGSHHDPIWQQVANTIERGQQ